MARGICSAAQRRADEMSVDEPQANTANDMRRSTMAKMEAFFISWVEQRLVWSHPLASYTGRHFI